MIEGKHINWHQKTCRSHRISSFAGSLGVALTSIVTAIVLASPAQGAEPETPKPPQPPAPGSSKEWRQAAMNDIQMAYKEELANHPGMYDKTNPGFSRQLAHARALGLEKAAQVTDGNSYQAAIQTFTTAIHDGHAGVYKTSKEPNSQAENWPGFVTTWRQQGLFVYGSELANVPVGSQVLACDGKPIAALITENVFSYVGRKDEPGQWWAHANKVFIDTHNPFASIPRHCSFKVDANSFEADLTWTPMTEQGRAWWKEAYNGDTLKVGVSEPESGIVWVAMPNFQPNEQEREAYRAMFKDVVDNRQRYSNAKAIVIDLRHNQGGSSEWSRQFAEALWGKSAMQQATKARNNHTETWWRASKDNTQYVGSLIKKFVDEKRESSESWARINYKGMAAALKQGKKFYVEKEDDDQSDAPNGKDAPKSDPLTTPVYVVVPGQCASACLDALDLFTLFSNTKLIGAPSSADSTYMDVRVKSLPSGLGVVVIPNKVYVNRVRANGQGYTPSIYVNDLVWSTENILKHIDADLNIAK